METTACMRGFSNTFVPDQKANFGDTPNTIKAPSVPCIEKDELERTWKTARRQRLKQQEEKIWTEFVKEQDILNSVCREDPYQFLEQLPEAHLKDLMDTELERMKLEALEDKDKEQKLGAGDTPRQDNQNTMTFTEMEQDDLFHIYDEDREEELSGIEEDGGGESPGSPCTVRERPVSPPAPPPIGPPSPPHSLHATASKSSENVANVIESSIYCAKVKDIRQKMDTVLNNIMASIENVNVACMDPQHVRKMCRRSSEFSSRFQRIHLYQIQRQIADIKRHNSLALPFAKHTQFQSQMVRIVALHQYSLQALQVFLKSIDQTSCLTESAEQIKTLCTLIKESIQVCKECAPPQDFITATELYNDNVEACCNKLELTVKNYVERVSDIVEAAQNSHSLHPKKAKNKEKKKKPSWSKSTSKANSKTEATARLSMYSLETLHHHHKGNASKDNGKGDKSSGRKRSDKTDKSPKSHRKSPRSRRPLMRAPSTGQPSRRRQPDAEIQTMVEAVEPPSSHMSRSPSPPRTSRRSARSPPPSRRSLPPHHTSPPRRNARSPPHVATKNQPSRQQLTGLAGHLKSSKRQTPYIKPPLSSIRSETQNTSTINEPQLSPVSNIQFSAKKQSEHNNLSDKENRGGELEIDLKTVKNESSRSSYRRGFDSARYAYDATNVLKQSAKSLEETTRGHDSGRSGNESNDNDGKENVPRASNSGRHVANGKKDKAPDVDPAGCEVTRLLRQLCGGDNGSRNEKYSGAKNAQLLCVNGSCSRQPSTPQLLRILEETIQKKVPKSLYHKPKPKDADRLRLAFNIAPQTADNLFQYRTKFVQHMLTSSLYANSAVGKPWEMIGSVSERIIDEILLKCAKEMEIEPIIKELYQSETQ